MTISADDWQGLLDTLRAEHDVVGAVLGVRTSTGTVVVGSGSANRAEQIDVTPDTLFQIGSITKVWTATLVLQLVDDGLLELDAPVTSYLTQVRLPDERVTVRHLLDHTSGLDGDHFLDTGRGDDCLAAYAGSLAATTQLHPPGVVFSYCNAGFSLAGRLLEVVAGVRWDDLLRTRLIEPLGLRRTVTLPEEALRFRTAMGHVRDEARQWKPADRWVLQRSSGPAGLITASAADLLTFAGLHLAGGVAEDGTRLLSAQAAELMRTPAVDVPERWLLGERMGLGWFVDDWPGGRTLAHGGTTLGQNAYLRLVPERGAAIALLTNGGGEGPFVRELIGAVLREVAGIDLPDWPLPVGQLVPDPGRFVGTFARAGHCFRVQLDERGVLSVIPVDPETGEGSPMAVLRPFLPDVVLAEFQGFDVYLPVVLHDVDGRRHLHTQGRTTPELTEI